MELLEDAADLPSFRHPLRAAYVLGPERSGLSPAMLAQCRHVVRIPTRFALNLAVAGAIVLYDRLIQHGRFADRPVGSGGAAPQARRRAAWRAGVPADAAGLDGRRDDGASVSLLCRQPARRICGSNAMPPFLPHVGPA